MKILSFLKSQSLSPAWSYSAGGVIWSLTTTNTGKLIGEERNLSEKKASFFCIEQNTGKVLWQNKRFGAQWWIGIEAIHNDVLFLHGFAKPDMPGHKGITAIDVLTGNQLWPNDDLRFVGVAGSSVFGCKDTADASSVFELNLRSGAIIRSLEDYRQVIKAERNQTAEAEHDQTRYPVPARLLPSVVADELMKHLSNTQIVGDVEAIDLAELVVFSFHVHAKGSTPEQPLFNTILQVLRKDTNVIVFGDEPMTNGPVFVPGSFHVSDNMLLYVKNRTTLTAVHLTFPTGGQSS